MNQQSHITGSGPAHQQGVGLLVFFVVLILAGSAFLLTHTPPESGRVQAENRTSEALASAKQALLAYAVGYYSREEPGRHGILPCPERSTGYNGDGNSSNQCGSRHTNSIGRLPWRHLQIPPPLDGSGECLWYALSGGFYNNPASFMTNDDTPGMFELYDASGNLLAGNTPEDRVVAVVIAPGATLAGQTRSAQTDLPCKQRGDLISSGDYLESFLGINNATVNEATADEVDSFITATGLANNSNLNDRIITISAAEIFDAIKARPELYDDRIAELGLALGQCLTDYAQVAALAIDNAGGGPPGGGPPGGGPPGGGPPGGGPPGGGPPGGGPPGGGPPGGGPPGGGPPGGGGSTLQSCYDDCDAARTLCRLSAVGSENAQCNQDRNSCRDACLNAAGVADFRLPWPAPVNLNSDYREDSNYIGLGDDSQGYSGRLPYDISASSNLIGITEDNLLNAAGSNCNLEDTNPELFTLWQHWKDHWFYVLGSDFAPSLATTPASVCNSNCPQVDGGARQAAILIFSGERINNRLRRTNETEDPDPPLAQSKGNLANYLEGDNLNNYPDNAGNGNYGVNNQNDRLFCINSAMNNVTECTP